MSGWLFGLGGSATNNIIGRLNLGIFDVTIEVEEVEPQGPSAGSSSGRPIILYPKEKGYKRVTITIRHKDRTWVKTYMVLEEVSNIVIKVIKTINKVTTSIRVKVSNAVTTFKTFRIRR
jgi:hypothetical protein